MQSQFAAEISQLTDVRSGHHMPAGKVSPSDILQFSVESMSDDLDRKAPLLSSTLASVLDAEPRKRRLREQVKSGHVITADEDDAAEDEAPEIEDHELDDLAETTEDTVRSPEVRTFSKRQRKSIFRFEALCKIVRTFT